MTLLANLPTGFRRAAHRFAEELKANFASLMRAQPEDQLKGPVKDLIEAAASNVATRTEPQVYELGGRPDIGVTVHGALCGHVELKAPGFGARTNRFRGRDKEQWEKFKALPNVLYTDAIQWALYRSGVHHPEDEPVVIELDDLIERGATALDDVILAKLHTLLLDFLTWRPIVPTTAPALAEMLAPLCRLLRTDVLVAVEREDSALHRLCGEIREYLFPHATDAQFADIYAQTLTYALLLARLSGETELTTAHAADRLDSGHGLLAQTLRILTQQAAREEIETAVDILERVIGEVDPEQLSRRGDPWIYFYEDFLAAYDPKLRKNYGVYYTPHQVIHCQINLVSKVLIQSFNKGLTFADEGVVYLDPGAGTAAYPIAAIESALRRVEERFGEGALAEFATRCAQNIYGFELLVGPYAVAHLRLTKMFTDAGATLPDDGIHMYLTDTLESPHTDPPQPPLMADRLTLEQRRARRVKEQVPVLVCMGNPPYFREEAEANEPRTRGKWVRFGDPNVPNERAILKDFTEPAGAHAQNLYNLYVYFWRWALWKMFENPQASGSGIVSFITASSYLRGPGFVGMRRKMREAFDEFWILDLEGSNVGARKTENIFDIQTPVCIAIGVRHAREKRNPLALARYARLTGTRDEKLEQLANIADFNDLQWRDCFSDAEDLFWPIPPASWSESPLLTDLWPWQHSGVQWKRNWPIGETRDVLIARWQRLVESPADQRAANFKESRDRRIDRQYAPLFGNGSRLRPIASLTPTEAHPTITQFAFRSFDRRWVLLDNRLGDFLRPSLWETSSATQVYLTTLLTCELGKGPAAVASAIPPDMNGFNNRASHTIPLWRDQNATQANLPVGLLSTLNLVLTDITAEKFYAYTYAVLSAPSYVETFWEELTVPGPRIPVTRENALFRRAVALGQRLLWLHSYGERFVPLGGQCGQIPQGAARCTQGISTSPSDYPEDVCWEANTLRVGNGEFSPVLQGVWEFSVSDFFVVQNWIKSRLRERVGRRTSPLDEIRPAAWTARMTQELLELLWVVEATLAAQPELDRVLSDVLAGPLFAAAELPEPTEEERKASTPAEIEHQGEINLDHNETEE
jgi:hypothetical protein